MSSDDDMQYAFETTRVLYEPDRRIDTFGSTSFEFTLITELLDEVTKVRVREGRINAERPTILRPEAVADVVFEGFGEQASQFADWLRRHRGEFAFLRYGFHFSRSEIQESVVHEPMETVADRVVSMTKQRGNPLSAVICGIDDAWEICLLRFTVEMIRSSQETNQFDFRRKGLL